MQSVIEMLGSRALSHPERTAIVAGDLHVSYGELWQRVRSVAQEFVRLGVGRGDRVLLAAPSAPAFAFAYFATHLIGAVAVPLDPHAPKARRDDLIERVRPKLVLGEQDEALAGPILFRAISELEGYLSNEAEFAPPEAQSLSDLLFTTGTTGRPKGVCLTHGNLVAAASHINSVIRIGESDVEVLPLPLYHSFGLGRLRCNLIAGASIVLVDGFRLPGEIFAAIERHRATGLVGVPAGFAVLLRFGARGLGAFANQLRYIEIGSAPMPIEHKRALMELLPTTELWMHYGLTEASRSVFIEFHRHHEHLDTVGLRAPGVQLAIRGEDGSDQRGEAGQLWIRGDHVSPGYWDDPASTASNFVAGWVRTGDVARLGDSGFLVLHGRNDDMINVGGFKVSPDEIERVLSQHPAVHEAMCIGVPDPRKIAGQVVRAYLVSTSTRASDEELSDWVAAHLERYKVPVEYRWTESLPRTSSGKPLRATLRNEAACEE